MLLYVKRTRKIFEHANKYYEDAFRLKVAKIVLKRLKKKPASPGRFCGDVRTQEKQLLSQRIFSNIFCYDTKYGIEMSNIIGYVCRVFSCQ